MYDVGIIILCVDGGVVCLVLDGFTGILSFLYCVLVVSVVQVQPEEFVDPTQCVH